MRITSKFHDYYDVGMSEGQDQSLVYQRYPIVEEREGCPFHTMSSGHRHDMSLYVCSYTIGFCGKLYKVLEINTLENASRNDKEGRSTRKWAYDLKDVDDYIHDVYPKHYSDYLEVGWRRNNRWSWHQRRNAFSLFFNGLPQNRLGDATEEILHENEEWRRSFFDKHQSPIFVVQPSTVLSPYGSRITYNASLKLYEFYRVFDPYQAYQEISMWLGNQAVPVKPIPEMTDQIKAESKGFNKFSFRKDPSKKRK